MSETVRKFVATTTSTEGLADKRQVLVNCSADGEDRQGDIVVQAGIKTQSFVKTGGTVLWSHDPQQPIAHAASIGLDGGQLRSLVQFPDSGISPKSDEIYGLIKSGVISGVSIGFDPIRWEPIDVKNPWGGRKYIEAELMEFSFVSVPAQTEATVIARSNGSWKVGASLNLPLGSQEEWDEAEAEASIFALAAFDGASPDYAFARKGFLAYDASNPKDKGSYKFPFAKVVDGRLTAMPSGVRAALYANVGELPADVRAKAGAVIEHYDAKIKSVDGIDDVELENLVEVAAAVAEIRSGRALSKENSEHVKSVRRCLMAMDGFHTKALDSHGMTHSDLEDFAEHLNTIGKCMKDLTAGQKAAEGDPAAESWKMLRKACKGLGDLHTAALDANSETGEHLNGSKADLAKARDHVKSLMKAAREKPKPDDEEDPEDPGEEYDANTELAAEAERLRMIEIAARRDIDL